MPLTLLTYCYVYPYHYRLLTSYLCFLPQMSRALRVVRALQQQRTAVDALMGALEAMLLQPGPQVRQGLTSFELKA